MRLSALIVFFLIGFNVLSQTDSARFFTDNQPDGIYISYEDFRWNRFISKEQIVSDMDREQLEFIGKIMSQEKITYRNAQGTATVAPGSVWAFFQNKTLYVNYKEEFYRVPVFGSICYLVATVTIVNNGFYDPMFGYGVSSTRSKEIREFILNYYDGAVAEFTMDKAEELLGRDPALYAEYKKLGRRKQKEQIYRFIRRYNEQHPVYFLK